MRRFTITTLAMLLALLYSPLIAYSGETEETEPEGKLLLLMDSSGSMREEAEGGQTKIEAAKSALKEVVTALPDNARVGMRVFGAKYEDTKHPKRCSDTDNVVPVGPIDRAALNTEIDKYKPLGGTPIGPALLEAAKDLGDGGKRTIVLMSDGEAFCDPKPCKVAKDLSAQGVDLTINVVGLDVNRKGRDELECIAKSGNGSYYDVDKPEVLSSSLLALSLRSLREFSLEGTPVEGGDSTADAVALEPGQYTDTTRGQGTSRYYLIDKPAGGGVAVSATARPERNDADEAVQNLRVQLLTPEGTICTESRANRVNVLSQESILSTAAYFSPVMARASDACLEAPRLLAHVHDDGGAAEYPFELVVASVPKVLNVDSLPAALDDGKPWEKPAKADGEVSHVTGGASFNNAPPITPGRYRDTIRPGEQLIYKVPADWGQAPRVTFTMETDQNADSVLGLLGIHAGVRAANPLRATLPEAFNPNAGVRYQSHYRGSEPVALTATVPPVRFLNRVKTTGIVAGVTMAGDYYFSIEVAGSDEAQGIAIPLTIAVEVEGEASGVPEFEGAIEGLSPEDEQPAESDEAKASDEGRNWLPWVFTGLGLAVLLAVIIVLVLMLRKGTKPPSSP